jgi:hypothetical protein
MTSMRMRLKALVQAYLSQAAREGKKHCHFHLKLRNNLSEWHTTAKIGSAGTVTGIPDVG